MNYKKLILKIVRAFLDDIIKAIDIYSRNMFKDEKLCKNMLIYDISYKTFSIWFDKIDRLIKIYDGIGYLVILGHSCFDEICDNIKYLISKKSGIPESINHNSARIRIDSYNFYLQKKH